MDTIKELTPALFLQLWKDEDGEPTGFTLVEDEDWTQDYKYQHRNNVYRHDASGRFFCVLESRSGSYHTDWYYNDPECVEVYAHVEVKTVTTYRTEKPA